MSDSAFEELHWERMSGPEVAALAGRTNVALVPLGCMEMHGPHLPTGTDGYHALATCERAATFHQVPGSAALRPGTRTAAPGLYLAGAWTDTGWPATMEGAVQSGLAAAEAALADAGLAPPTQAESA